MNYMDHLNTTKSYQVNELPQAAGKSMNQNSVNTQADNVLEISVRARLYAEGLLGELRQADQCCVEPRACRSGIDGKLIDAADHSSATLAVLQEIRAYLLG